MKQGRSIGKLHEVVDSSSSTCTWMAERPLSYALLYDSFSSNDGSWLKFRMGPVNHFRAENAHDKLA
jgi:hypothetical protein